MQNGKVMDQSISVKTRQGRQNCERLSCYLTVLQSLDTEENTLERVASNGAIFGCLKYYEPDGSDIMMLHNRR